MNAVNPTVKPIAKDRSPSQFSLKPPREHGVVVVFVLSTVLSIKIGLSLGLGLLPLLGSIWLIFLLLHEQQLSLLAGIFCASTIGILFHSPVLAMLIFFFSSGKSILNTISTHLGFSWRESFGMLAVAATPLLAVSIGTGNSTMSQTITLAFTASAILSLVLTHVLRRDSFVGQGPTLILFLLTWLYLWAEDPIIFAWCLSPFALQLTWLFNKTKPSFAQLGAIQTISLLFVSTFLFLQNP